MALEVLLNGEAEAITRRAIEMAMNGDTTAMRLVLERILPPRKDRPVNFALPKLEVAADAVKASAALAEAVREVTQRSAGAKVVPLRPLQS